MRTEPNRAEDVLDCAEARWGRVVALEGGDAWIEIEAGCGRCQEEGGCGGVSLTQLFGGRRRFRLANACGATMGERVRVVLAGPSLTRQAAWVYGLPLLGVVLGALMGNLLAGDAGALAGAALGLCSAWLAVKIWAQGSGKSGGQPHIVKVQSEKEAFR